MGACTLNGPDGLKIESVAQMFGLFSGEVSYHLTAWEGRLAAAPDEMEAIEKQVKEEFQRGAALVLAGLFSVVLASKDLAQASEQTRQGFSYPLAKGRVRTIRVRLLGNLVIWVSSLYCEPKKGVFRRKQKDAAGLYVELAQFGFGKGISPALQSDVARKAALCPSLQFARQELERDGVKLDLKSVRRIANQCGEDHLKLRALWIAQHREGRLQSTGEVKGLRVSVQIDGGRAKLRSALRERTEAEVAAAGVQVDADGLPAADEAGRSKRRPKRTFDAQWREPKLVTIFVHDDEGRMVEKSQATVDGTLAGPDALAEIVAMHLHRLGAAQAESITFVADGAPWIWERIDWILSLAKIPAAVKIHEVLDCCHAVHHVQLAAKELGLEGSERHVLYRAHRLLLRNGHWRQVVDELNELAAERPENPALQAEIEYLRKHGEAGRLSYVHFRSLGIPIGSGAIESSIRRVINLRIKGNSIFWLEDNAETMLQLRCQVISGRWDERLRSIRAMNRKTSLSSWKFTPLTNPKNEANSEKLKKPKKSPQIT